MSNLDFAGYVDENTKEVTEAPENLSKELMQ